MKCSCFVLFYPPRRLNILKPVRRCGDSPAILAPIVAITARCRSFRFCLISNDPNLKIMEVPPKARGPGRSGPRRRTGCLTCRSRKVRCDEAKPNCAHCTRLRLQCVYRSVIISGDGVSEGPAQSRTRARSSTSSTTQDAEELESPRANVNGKENTKYLHTLVRPDEQVGVGLGAGQFRHDLPPPPQQQHQQQHHTLSPGGPPAQEFSIPFDMLGFIGEITSDFQQKHQDLTNRAAIAPSPRATAEIDGGIFQDERQMVWGPGGMGNMGILPDTDAHPPQQYLSGGEVWEEQLLEHFRKSKPPPTIFGPVCLEWEYVKDTILVQSGDCQLLLLAIYCYSDIHKAWVEGTQWKFGPTYHIKASEEIQTCLLGDMSEVLLKRIFASVLLLMLAELIAPDGWRPTTPFLHTSYLLLQRFHHRTDTWTGFAHLIASWVSLLDIKALVAGRDGDPLAELGTLTPKLSSNSPSSLSSGQLKKVQGGSDQEPDPLLTKPAFLITSSITLPAFTFFLRTQQLIRRIVIIDLHHRTRGTVSDEFEVLQIAHTVSADLESLWNTRPQILDVYSSSGSEEHRLHEILAPKVAVSIVRAFRTYVANFLALFIYLHRVAFAIYPRTDRVYRAVDQIIWLAKEEASRPSTSDSTGDGDGACVPVGFVWPLFIAALEGSIEQRGWIVGAMQKMAALTPPGLRTGMGTGDGRHPNAGKVLVLLEEMTRRQDASRTWADSKCVRQELFADFFVMI
ncbi:hypothetical protein BJX63DRAFT_218194 [Aspergillus granulosus]|uniref:Zn(2)-C6 fungal-type domain-containing protein n=1 Tax=Aspergillus granulosus TaxID=176169 RepID=A0ABR4I190_9EURO